jgi:hypothetical protein
METRRGFVFSLDAFVAFSIALVAIYSLIYFSSVPHAYYSSLLQAHYLAKDTLVALSSSESQIPGFSKLDYMSIYLSEGSRGDAAKEDFGSLIPEQFGYTVEISEDGKEWKKVYTTEGNADETHKKTKDKLAVSAQTISFEYKLGTELPENPYNYISCGGEFDQCNPTDAPYFRNEAGMYLIKLTVFT